MDHVLVLSNGSKKRDFSACNFLNTILPLSGPTVARVRPTLTSMMKMIRMKSASRMSPTVTHSTSTGKCFSVQPSRGGGSSRANFLSHTCRSVEVTVKGNEVYGCVCTLGQVGVCPCVHAHVRAVVVCTFFRHHMPGRRKWTPLAAAVKTYVCRARAHIIN